MERPHFPTSSSFWYLRKRSYRNTMPWLMEEKPPLSPRRDGMDAKADYERFRSILRDHVENILERQPEVARGRWEFECYRSFSVFEATFPNAQRREVMLQDLAKTKREIDEEVRAASKKMRALFDRRQT